MDTQISFNKYFQSRCLMLIMIKLRRVALGFARNRIRREIQFDSKLKDYTDQEIIKVQTEQKRRQYQSIPNDKFTDILNNPNPRPGSRFWIPKKQLNKKIVKTYRDNVKMGNIETDDGMDLDYLSAGKSHLNNQQKQIQFEMKFKEKLFRTKQTQRLINKKEKEVHNYIDGKQKDQQFMQYLQAKNELKNKKISNMMNMNRNNQQLELLISSGLFNDPKNLSLLIDKLRNQTQEHNQPPLLGGQPLGKQFTYANNNQKSLISLDEQKPIQNLLEDIGPQQLKQRDNVKEFMRKFEQQSQLEKQACKEDVNLLKRIREYEQKVFLSRYDAINFRFKGRMTFEFFKQPQLIAYIKNQNIEPKDLLQIFDQNQNVINKFKVPILTPAVLSNIYSKSSLYKFPQSEQNNRVNMLNDPLFQSLQRKTFKQITKINDMDFCSIVWAYGKNHEDQQGLLNQPLYSKINDVIFEEAKFRIGRLKDEDLGLLTRGLSKLSLGKDGSRWEQLLQFFAKRCPKIQDLYAIESVFSFLLCLPINNKIAQILLDNIQKLGQNTWQETDTVQTFVNCCGLLLKYKNGQSTALVIKQMLIKQQTSLHVLLPKLSINKIPQFLTVLRQSEASLELPRIVNLSKKLAVQNIKAQKQLIKSQTIGRLVGSFGLIDFQKYHEKKKSKYSAEKNSKSSFRQYTLKILLPFQPISFNSTLFFVYHDIAQFVFSQIAHIPNIYLSQIIDNLSLVRYKNQQLYDEISQKILRDIDDLQTKRFLHPGAKSPKLVMKQLVSVINSYAFQRRYTQCFSDALQLLLNPKYYKELSNQSPNLILRLITGIISLGGEENNQIKRKLKKLFDGLIVPLLGSNSLIQQEIASAVYCGFFLEELIWINEKEKLKGAYQNKEVNFIIQFCLYLEKLRSGQKVEKCSADGLIAAQGRLYNKIHEQIVHNQTCIGSPFEYNSVYDKIFQVLKQNHGDIEQKKWRLEVQSLKRVYLIWTYDHLMVNSVSRDQEKLRGYGIWRLYEKYYQILGWQVKKRIAFMEGR